MKKLIIAMAMAASVAAFADVESANIVGFAEIDHTGKQYVQIGQAFMDVAAKDGAKTFKLSNIQPKVMDAASDIVFVTSPVNARTLDSMTYVTPEVAGEDTDLIGWWNLNIDETKDDLEFDIGQGFKVNFAAKDVVFDNAGQVNTEATTVDYTGKQYVAVPNILPRTVKLGEIVGIGVDPASDMIMSLDPANAKTLDSVTYVDAETAGEETDLIGWWDLSIEESKNDVEIPANGALYANFAAMKAKLAFPAAITK